MNDIQRAADLASTVLPGPIGEAVMVVLADHSEDEHPDPNIHELAYRILQASRGTEPSQATGFTPLSLSFQTYWEDENTGRYGALLSCPKCSAVVFDDERHAQWHGKQGGAS